MYQPFFDFCIERENLAMEHKAWLWSRRTTEKTIIANGTAAEGDEDKETGSSRFPSNLSKRLAFSDCTAKEEQLRKHARMAEEELASKEMAEAEAAFLKQELDKALQQGEAAEQRLAHLEAALKDCMQEIGSLKGEQDERLQNAVTKATVDFEKAQKKLESKLAESNKRVTNLSAENTSLMKALLCKEKLIEDLDNGKAQLEAEFDMLMARLDSAQEDNAFLKYKCRFMEEELELLTEQREFSRRSTLENAKQINKLEAECQQLRNLIRKRLQSPTIGNFSEKPSKGTSFLIQRVYEMEEENKTLRDIVSLNDTELQSWRTRCCQMASRLAEVEAQLKELSEDRQSGQLALPGFELSNREGISDCESWAGALSAELEHFRQGHIRNQAECQALELCEKNALIEAENYALVTTGIDTSGVENQLQSTSEGLVLQKRDSWLDEVLNLILEEHRVSNRSFSELLQDIEIVLGCKDGISKQKEESCSNISGLLPWKSPNPTDTSGLNLQGTPSNNPSAEEKGQNIEDASFTREKIRKHFGFDRSKSENQLSVATTSRHNTLAQMIKIQSALQEENRDMKEKLQLVAEENVDLRKQLRESDENIGSLRREVDALRETKGVVEDQMENQRLINEDLDTQLTVAKAKLNEILHKLSSLEVELEDKNNCCEELEATCLELQLQLETISRKESPNPDVDQLAKKLKTESIQNLEGQLRALPSPDTMLVDMALRPTTTSTDPKAPASHKKSLAPKRSSLRDRMLAEDDDRSQRQALDSSNTKEKASDEDLQKPPSFNQSNIKALPAPEVKVRSSEQVGTLAIVPSKKPSRGFGFITKLFLRRKRSCSKMKTVPLQRSASPSIRQKEVLLVA